MLKLNSMMIGTMNLAVMKGFYEKILEAKPMMDEDNWAGWQVGGTFLMLGKHDQMTGKAKDAGRVMFDLETEQVKEEFDRMVKLGARAVKEPYQMEKMWIATLADPDGNYFQLMSPWKDK